MLADDQPTDLYRLFNRADQLLYVGISWSALSRITAHRAEKHWWNDVSRVEITNFLSRADAEGAERDAIRDEKPIHNVVHNNGRSPQLPTHLSRSPRGPRTSESNPAGLREFDHSYLIHLPEYRAVSEALDGLVHVMDGPGFGLSQADWLELVTDITAALPFADCCTNCRNETMELGLWFPFRTEIHEGSMRGTYRCDKGHMWTCGYALEIPAWF